MTTTEKRYARQIGKLFLVRERRYNSDIKKFQIDHTLCMVYGMRRSGYNGTTGPFNYLINTLSKVEREYLKDYAVRCTEFFNGRRRYWGNRTYEELTKENMELVGKVIDSTD